MTLIDPTAIAETWLSEFSSAVYSADASRVAECFLQDGWFKDVLIFTWTNRTLHNRENIAAYLENTLGKAKITGIQIDKRPHLAPELGQGSQIISGFTFSTSIFEGQGYFRLIFNGTEWKALSVLMSAESLIGHEELAYEHGYFENHAIAWEDVLKARRQKIEEDPHVVIVGGGHAGLMVAARFKQMQIPTLVLEANQRIGDSWRGRYSSLTLHTTRNHHTLLYQDYPANWPKHTPKDKFADWLEQYSIAQDLTIWKNSRLLPTPTYDSTTKKWSVTIDKSGSNVTLHPTHLILATGLVGDPATPVVSGLDCTFKGPAFHACHYRGGKEFANKNVVVIGAGNSSADICQDLYYCGATVTMVQRSSTCVVSLATSSAMLDDSWPDGVPVEVSDFKATSVPLLFLKGLMKTLPPSAWSIEMAMHERLQKAGLKADLGPEGTGHFPTLYDRCGGYWLDVGCAELISDGKIKVKQGVEIDHLEAEEVVFTDGSTIPADVIIFSTGYKGIRQSMRALMGDDTIDRTCPVWGFDEEGEINGVCRPTGHPGLWYAVGDPYNIRRGSKQLALTIKGIELGLLEL